MTVFYFSPLLSPGGGLDKGHFRFAEKDKEGAEFMNATDIFKILKKEEGSVLRGVTAHAFSRMLPAMGRRVHTKWGNGYYVVRA